MDSRIARFLLWVGVVFAASPAPLEAITFSVDGTADAADAVAGDGVCETATGACTLRAALEEADALAGFDEVELPAGTFEISLGRIAIADDVSITGSSAAASVVEGRPGALAGFDIAAATNVEMSGFTIRRFNPGRQDSPPGAIHNSGSLTLTDMALSRNVFRNGTGAALHNLGSAQLTDVLCERNRAEDGGTIFNAGTLSLEAVTVARSHAFRGGALLNGGTATVTASTLSRNRGLLGGAIVNSGMLTLTNVTMQGNRAKQGGALANQPGFGGVALLIHVTMSKNRARAGAALFRDTSGPLPNDIATTLVNCVINGIKRRNCYTAFSPVPFVSLGHNLENGNSCEFSQTEDVSDVTPLLDRKALDNGGPTATVALRPGSPAIDAADPAYCPPTDQRGVARPQGLACDIGAFELVP